MQDRGPMESVFLERRHDELRRERDQLRAEVERLSCALEIATVDSDGLLFRLATLLDEAARGRRRTDEVEQALAEAERCGWKCD